MIKTLSATALITSAILASGCSSLSAPQAVAVAGVGCWLAECSVLYPANVAVPSYYNHQVSLNERYQAGKVYSMDDLRCMNNSAYCPKLENTTQIRQRHYSKPYLLSE